MLADRVRVKSSSVNVNPIIYQAGDAGDDWILRGKSNSSHKLGTVTFGSSYLEWKGMDGHYDGIYTKSPIDLSKYSYLELEFSSYEQPRTTVRYDIQNINKKLYIEVFIGISSITTNFARMLIVGWSNPNDFEGEYNILYLGRRTGEFGWEAYDSKDKTPISEVISQYIYRIELIK